MVNVYDSANQLAEDLQKTPEFTALRSAVQTINQDAKSKALFKKMDEIQGKIVAARRAGKDLSADLKQEYQDLSQQVQQNKKITQLLQAEERLYRLIDDLQKTCTHPVNDLFADLRK